MKSSINIFGHKATHLVGIALVAASISLGIIAPIQSAFAHDDGGVTPYYMVSTVKHRYKAFSGDQFYVPEYDVTYRELRYNKRYEYTGSKAISYYEDQYNGHKGHVTQFECQYRVYN